MIMNIRELSDGLLKLNIHLETETVEKLLMFLDLLNEWNAVHNLTAITDPKTQISKHLLDSLSVIHDLTGNRILDVGTGAGLPGIPLALACPALTFILLDSNQKKINFVQYALIKLGIQNAQCICSRVEKYKPDNLFDCVIARAYASIEDFVSSSGHLVKPLGRLLAMKGKVDLIEQQRLPIGYNIEAQREIKVPGLNEDRCLIIVKKK